MTARSRVVLQCNKEGCVALFFVGDPNASAVKRSNVADVRRAARDKGWTTGPGRAVSGYHNEMDWCPEHAGYRVHLREDDLATLQLALDILRETNGSTTTSRDLEHLYDRVNTEWRRQVHEAIQNTSMNNMVRVMVQEGLGHDR